MVVRKRFGQHFLHDPAVIRRIIESIAPRAGERIVEIGPGRGALTWGLLERSETLDVIEIDRDLAEAMRADPRGGGRLRVHAEDVLETDFEKLRGEGPPLRVVGNLPYNISTPVLFRLLSQRYAISDMHFMLQKEVVDRMTAASGGKAYGRLTVMLGVYAAAERLFDVGPGAFKPPPRVWSAVIRVRPTPGPRFAIGSDAALRTLVTAAFSHRRKTLRNGLKSFLRETDFESCGIDPERRPETLEPAEFGRLAARYCQNAGAP
jgi:16S rRNA (adenine1518-N6/adenine1519-N6)-dimethyltransferase